MDTKLVVELNERFCFNSEAYKTVPHDVWRQKFDAYCYHGNQSDKQGIRIPRL